MAIRLNVIMVHSPPAIPGAAQLAESIVGELIGRPGIDVALVGALDGITENSTDALTLESITGDVAVLDWRSPENVVDALATLQFFGDRASHPNDSECDKPGTKGRKIYAFDLQANNDAKQLCNDVQALLASRRVQTFSIGSIAKAQQPTSVQTTQPPLASRPEVNPPSSQGVSLENRSGPRNPTAATSIPANSEIDLDDLVDQLDQLDP